MVSLDIARVQPTSGAKNVERVSPRSETSGFDDTFLKKVGDWAFNTFFLSSLNQSQDVAGHRAIRPLDAVVMDFVNLNVSPSRRLPAGHLYTSALTSVQKELESVISSSASRTKEVSGTILDVLSVLEKDADLRDYLVTRQLEYYYG